MIHEGTKTKQTFRAADVAFIGIAAAIIAVCSWVSIPTAVPFTLQTFAVFASLLILGGKNGFFAVLTYLLLGAVGVPVFAGFKGGLAALLGNTGGYLLGFLLLAAVYWLITALAGEKLYIQILALSAGLLVCYAFGTAWFMMLYIKTNGPVSLLTVLGWCVFPFLLPDAVKMALALLLSKKIKLPNK
ncbi:MAG: biotin transporter BioY [Ruminococcaceae bacterium]|nr:biotin transporter BioY [Oscillospiraceae bacterium]